MEKIHTLPDLELMDMLSTYTFRYTQMIVDRNRDSKEFIDCKRMVKFLQQEIESRKNPSSDNVLLLQD
jgi:hypothetical protein